VALSGTWTPSIGANGWTAAQANSPLDLLTTIELPAEWDGSESVLRLEGLWWNATISVNNQSLPPVTGGLAPVDVTIGDQLKPGSNQIAIQITPPTGESRTELGGGLAAKWFDWNKAALLSAPVLFLQHSQAIASLSVEPTNDGQVVATAFVNEAPENATVQFYAALDGKKIQDLGSASVSGRKAVGPTIPWEGEYWSLGNPELIHIVAELTDAKGTLIDRLIVRTAPRTVEVKDNVLQLNNQPLRLMTGRTLEVLRRPTFLPQLKTLVQGGVNALEIHGELTRNNWLDTADELGLPLVVLPRCIGRIKNDAPPSDELDTTMAQQDARMLQAFQSHPSLLVWNTEGTPPKGHRIRDFVPLWTETLLEDPVSRLIVQRHMPGKVLSVSLDGSGHSCDEDQCAGAWLTETTTRRKKGETNAPNRKRAKDETARWAALSAAFIDANQKGAVSGSIANPDNSTDPTWAPAYKSAAETLQIRQLTQQGLRAKSFLTVTGGQAGHIAVLHAPWSQSVGAVFDANGQAELSIWHEGPAELRAADSQQTVQMTAQSWENFERTGPHVQASLE